VTAKDGLISRGRGGESGCFLVDPVRGRRAGEEGAQVKVNNHWLGGLTLGEFDF